MENFDYKEYSLKNLKDAVCDSIETECTPEEIKQAVVDALQELVDYHLERMNKAATTIAQMKSDRNVDTVTGNVNIPANVYPITDAVTQKDWDDFWKSDDPNQC